MSDVIQLLPDSVANQIAAGEVIQRPASVIKELVENAIDAGAQAISVIVTDAGRTAIQVIDDGKGMSETDARLAFERHATSKIRKADDLFALRTMGFRGEALASIAAVAQVELKTRMAANDVGTHICISGSRVTSQEPAACPVGSNFLVENLFFNVPARRKFLKTNATELNNILTAYERIVLVYPAISFSMQSNGTEMLNLRAGSLRQRISDVFGKRFNQDILPINVDTTICRISGFVGKPEAARKKGAHQYFFVNGRYMKHPYFHKAVMNAYERLLPVGMQVPYFIYFDVEPADIDVNIHPTKTEIKFENEQAIWQILTAAVKDAIGLFCDVPSIDFDTEGRPDIPVFGTTRNVTSPEPSFNPSYNPFATPAGTAKHVPDKWQTLYEDAKAAHRQMPDRLFTPPTDSDDEELESNRQSDEMIAEKSPAHYQYKGRYVMTAVKSGLMIIDQHRADVRIRYERFLARMESEAAGCQRVLFPEVITFSPSEAVIVSRIMPELGRVGFELTDLGGNSFAVNGIPAGLEGLDIVAMLHDMVTEATDKSGSRIEEIKKSIAFSMARHSAIPQGQILGNDEMENIINELFACSNVNYTPDGKPIITIFRQDDMERLFG
ncbi:MAG: DNA mismatch repair endonuclease MutL [Prevotella sp.]